MSCDREWLKRPDNHQRNTAPTTCMIIHEVSGPTAVHWRSVVGGCVFTKVWIWWGVAGYKFWSFRFCCSCCCCCCCCGCSHGGACCGDAGDSHPEPSPKGRPTTQHAQLMTGFWPFKRLQTRVLLICVTQEYMIRLMEEFLHPPGMYQATTLIYITWHWICCLRTRRHSSDSQLAELRWVDFDTRHSNATWSQVDFWYDSRWWFSNIFYFHLYLGKIPILTNVFQMGWNHQLVIFSWGASQTLRTFIHQGPKSEC